MWRLFEWLGSIIAIAAIVQIASDPKDALDDIRRGPAPNLRAFSDKLMGTGTQQRQHRAKGHDVIDRYLSSVREKRTSK